MIKEKSAGAILFYLEDNEPIYLFLKHRSGHLDITKGNIEENESPLQAAEREIKEETGIDKVEFINGFSEKINYYYKLKGELIYKEVIIYLARSFSKEVKISPEHLGYVWLNSEEALKQIKFENAKEVFFKADKFIRENILK